MKLAHYRAGSGSVSSVSTVPRFPPQAPRNEVSVFDSPAVSSPTSHLAPLHVRSPFDAYATSSVFRAEVGIDSGPESLTMQHRSVSYAEQRSVSAVRHPTPPPPQRLGGGGGGIPAQPTPQTSPKPEEAWLRERNPPGNVTPPLKSAEKPKEEPWYLQSWRSPQKGEQPPPPPPPPRSASTPTPPVDLSAKAKDVLVPVIERLMVEADQTNPLYAVEPATVAQNLAQGVALKKTDETLQERITRLARVERLDQEREEVVSDPDAHIPSSHRIRQLMAQLVSRLEDAKGHVTPGSVV